MTRDAAAELLAPLDYYEKLSLYGFLMLQREKLQNAAAEGTEEQTSVTVTTF